MKLAPLYKRSSTGKISFWQIEVEGNKFRTESGFTDGKKIISEWTECIGKNKGKSNSTDANKQAVQQAKALHKKKMELGAFEDIKDIDQPVFFKPMLAREMSEVDIEFPMASQPKYDGVRCIVTSSGMQSRNGKKIISAPHILESLLPIFEVFPDLVLDGELFAEKSEEMDFNKIISCVRKTKPTEADLIESAKYIKYFVYDCPSCDLGFIERKNYLNNLGNLPDTIVLVPTEIVLNMDDVKKLFSQYVGVGYEGEMLRTLDGEYQNKRSKHLIKYKEFITEEFIIKDVIEGNGKLAGKVGKVVVDVNGQDVSTAVNGDHEYLEMLFQSGNLIGKPATVRFQDYTPDGSLRFPKVIAIRDYE